MTWQFVTGPMTATALFMAAVVYLVGVVRRERSGPKSRQATLATSAPGWSLVVTTGVGGAVLLVIVRLGVLS